MYILLCSSCLKHLSASFGTDQSVTSMLGHILPDKKPFDTHTEVIEVNSELNKDHVLTEFTFQSRTINIKQIKVKSRWKMVHLEVR